VPTATQTKIAPARAARVASAFVVAPLVARAVLAGGLAGTFLRDRLPGRHPDEDTRWLLPIGFLSTRGGHLPHPRARPALPRPHRGFRGAAARRAAAAGVMMARVQAA
jgi:hypothetical protein